MDCTECKFRTERTFIKNGKIDFLEILPDNRKLATNKKGFCYLGYTQNPKTRKAKVRAFENGAQLCEFLK